ncbi:MAG: hypothetical protein ACLUSP_03065 [Christensenellales bacterium]
MVIADKNANAIFTVSADDAGVSPVPSAPEASDFDDERIFRFAKTDAVLYNSTDEADVAATLKKDERVIVLKYDFGYGYAYCAVENEREELIYGYAFRSTLTEPLAYVEPAAHTAWFTAIRLNFIRCRRKAPRSSKKRSQKTTF